MIILRSVQVEGLHVGPFPDRDAAREHAMTLGLTDYTIHMVHAPIMPPTHMVTR